MDFQEKIKDNINYKKLISVIVPIFNVDRYLPKCLDSIIQQTYPYLDIILVDDGSTDCCGEICEQYAGIDSRVRVFHINNCGLAGARNFGIEQAMGMPSDYIAFVDSDDWLEENMYEVLLKQIESKDVEIAICGYYTEWEGRSIKVDIPNKYFNRTELMGSLIKNEINTMAWNKLWRKDQFKDIRFPLGRFFEDIATTYKIFANVAVAVGVSQPLYHYRIRKGSISQTRTLVNLVDFWIVHKDRFDYFYKTGLLEKNSDLLDKMYYYFATAVTRTWIWMYLSNKQERKRFEKQIEEMRSFSCQHFSAFGKKDWPLKLRLGIFWTRFNNDMVFFFLYYLNLVYRWGKKKINGYGIND